MTKTDDISNKSFNRYFCEILEFHLSRTFKNSLDKNIRDIWCDGISHIPDACGGNRKYLTSAWIGKDGQDQYKMLIHFGEKASHKLSTNQDLTDCIPSEKLTNWFSIDFDKKTIDVFLK